VYRFANSTALLADNAFLKWAKISEENLKLLKQRGANDDQTPDNKTNPHSFWAKQQKDVFIRPIHDPVVQVNNPNQAEEPENRLVM
jgi:hypothetical protein